LPRRVHLRELALGEGSELSREGSDLLRLSFRAGAALDVAAFERAGLSSEKAGHCVFTIENILFTGRMTWVSHVTNEIVTPVFTSLSNAEVLVAD